MSLRPQNPLKIGVAGLGAIGMPVARWLDGGADKHKLVLSGVSAGDRERAKKRVGDFNTPPSVLSLKHLVEVSDVVVEGLPPDIFEELALSLIHI